MDCPMVISRLLTTPAAARRLTLSRMLMPLKDWDGQWYLKDKYMSEFNIKISELNDVNPNPPSTEDFSPLVHSASMTTYKATIQDIGSLITHSIYADTASVALFYPPVISASHANNADKSISDRNDDLQSDHSRHWLPYNSLHLCGYSIGRFILSASNFRISCQQC